MLFRDASEARTIAANVRKENIKTHLEYWGDEVIIAMEKAMNKGETYTYYPIEKMQEGIPGALIKELEKNNYKAGIKDNAIGISWTPPPRCN